MERRQLEYFVAIVEHGGFSAAARALHVAQPSLSRSIGKLEHELEVTLFHRVGRTAVLSAAGEALAALWKTGRLGRVVSAGLVVFLAYQGLWLQEQALAAQLGNAL